MGVEMALRRPLVDVGFGGGEEGIMLGSCEVPEATGDCTWPTSDVAGGAVEAAGGTTSSCGAACGEAFGEVCSAACVAVCVAACDCGASYGALDIDVCG